jgi:hypothetical protein
MLCFDVAFVQSAINHGLKRHFGSEAFIDTLPSYLENYFESFTNFDTLVL